MESPNSSRMLYDAWLANWQHIGQGVRWCANSKKVLIQHCLMKIEKRLIYTQDKWKRYFCLFCGGHFKMLHCGQCQQTELLTMPVFQCHPKLWCPRTTLQCCRIVPLCYHARRREDLDPRFIGSGMGRRSRLRIIAFPTAVSTTLHCILVGWPFLMSGKLSLASETWGEGFTCISNMYCCIRPAWELYMHACKLAQWVCFWRYCG